MTTKVFKLVANVIRVNNNIVKAYNHGAETIAEKQLLNKIASDFCAEFGRVNGRFNKEEFLAACGLDKISLK